MAKINLFTQIRLIEDLPKYGLIQGDIGTIVECYHDTEGEYGYSLEGLIPLDTVEISESQIELVSQYGTPRKEVNDE
jgi:hypothetical protein